MTPSKLAQTIVASCALLASPLGAQQSTTRDSTIAEALYLEGNRLLQQREFEAACPKLEESQRLDAGLGTTLALAYCYEHTRRPALAWALYREAEALAQKQGDSRETEAAQRAQELESSLSTLTIFVPDSARVEGLTVKRNGVTLGRASWNVALPVDPGEWVVEVSAPGRQGWVNEVAVQDSADHVRVVVPVLKAAASGEPPARLDDPAPLEPGGATTAVSPAVDHAGPTEGGWTARRIAGGASVAGGLAGIGIGLVFLDGARRKYERADDGCEQLGDSGLVCTPDGAERWDDQYEKAKDARRNGTIAVGTGSALVLGGVALILLDIHAKRTEKKAGVEVSLTPEFSEVRFETRF